MDDWREKKKSEDAKNEIGKLERERGDTEMTKLKNEKHEELTERRRRRRKGRKGEEKEKKESDRRRERFDCGRRLRRRRGI